MRLLSHHQRARSVILAVVPLLRVALTRWFPVATSEAAAKPFFSLCLTEHPSQIQTSAILRTLERLVTAVHSLL